MAGLRRRVSVYRHPEPDWSVRDGAATEVSGTCPGAGGGGRAAVSPPVYVLSHYAREANTLAPEFVNRVRTRLEALGRPELAINFVATLTVGRVIRPTRS
jgi:hypothetical protein